MILEEVYQFFGSANKAANVLNITRQAFYGWIRRGYIPLKQQIKIEKITKGKLIAKKEDANPNNTINADSHYLASFRYYDKKHGMCRVESLHFRKGKLPKITYVINGNNREKFAVFDTKNLMQASDIVDSSGDFVYEGDICKLKNGEEFVFKSLDMANKLKKLGTFKIIGNIFE